MQQVCLPTLLKPDNGIICLLRIELCSTLQDRLCRCSVSMQTRANHTCCIRYCIGIVTYFFRPHHILE